MMQEWIVAAIVAYAFWVVARRYAPKSVKRAVRSRVALAARRFGWQRLALRLQTDAVTKASGCSDGCSSCGACSPAETSTADKPEFVIPIKVEKRPVSH